MDKLKEGYRRFYEKHFAGDCNLYEKLATKGQEPLALVIACSDSRVDPALVLDAAPGDIFLIRNVANLVPPYQPDPDTHHGVSAALEFGIDKLNIPRLIVLGHSKCAGIRALMSGQMEEPHDEFSFIDQWVNIGKAARVRVLEKHEDDDFEVQCASCEKENVITSLDNLMTFPWIKSRVEEGSLTVQGWYFCLEEGSIESYDPDSGKFIKIE